MSFLSRHRSQRDTSASEKGTGLATPPREHEEKSGINAGSLRKRLSSFTLLGSSKRQNNTKRRSTSNPLGVEYVAPESLYTRESSRSPSPAPSLTIRRPSGLGRRASQTAEEDPDELRAMFENWLPANRQRCISSPETAPSNSQQRLAAGAPTIDQQSSGLGNLRAKTSLGPGRRSFDFSRMPTELLKSIFVHSTKQDLSSIALACRAFTWPARMALYEHLDIRDFKDPQRVQSCMARLASQREYAIIVRTFACGLAPESGSSNGSSPLLAVTFAVALANMINLQSLTLPHFDPLLVMHTSFDLRHFALLCESMSLDEFRDLFTWLPGQATISSLSLPRLATVEPTSPTPPDSQPTHGKSLSQSSAQDTLALSLPSNALTQLSHFRGPSSLIPIIVPERPVQSLSIIVHSTLYDGLRPSALMVSVARSKTPITSLSIVASSKNVDARTFERLLMSVGAELGESLQTLEIEWILEDELLYKQICSVLPRFLALHSLRLRRRQPPPPPLSPPPSLPLPSTQPSPETPPPSPPLLSTTHKTNIGSPDVLPLPRVHERTHLVAWSKQCRSLRNAAFLSGAEWRIGVGEGVIAGLPTFHFIGVTRT